METEKEKEEQPLMVGKLAWLPAGLGCSLGA